VNRFGRLPRARMSITPARATDRIQKHLSSCAFRAAQNCVSDLFPSYFGVSRKFFAQTSWQHPNTDDAAKLLFASPFSLTPGVKRVV
jgi:hypothetical protein